MAAFAPSDTTCETTAGYHYTVSIVISGSNYTASNTDYYDNYPESSVHRDFARAVRRARFPVFPESEPMPTPMPVRAARGITQPRWREYARRR